MVSPRDAASGDLTPILSIARECFGASAWTPAQFQPLENPGHARWILVVEAPDAATAAPPAWAAPAPAGRLSAGGVSEPPRLAGYIVIESSGMDAEVQALAVWPQWRQLGIGGALLAAGMRRAAERGATQVFLEVRLSNAGAQAFYRRHGFREYGRRERYYHDPEEAALQMRWPGSGL